MDDHPLSRRIAIAQAPPPTTHGAHCYAADPADPRPGAVVLVCGWGPEFHPDWPCTGCGRLTRWGALCGTCQQAPRELPRDVDREYLHWLEPIGIPLAVLIGAGAERCPRPAGSGPDPSWTESEKRFADGDR